MDIDESRIRIIEATVDEFNEKGIKFTMDDIAKRLMMSKKTIYSLFKDKQTLFFETVDYCFEQIKISEKTIVDNEQLNTVEKLKGILIVLPDRYKSIDWRQIYQMRDAYPKLYKRIAERIETGWESTIKIINDGIDEGVFKNISIPIFKSIIEGTIESFISDDRLIKNNISYEEALQMMLDIVISGVCI